jgi:hypothetical protein
MDLSNRGNLSLIAGRQFAIAQLAVVTGPAA